jgi:hypothetical protein
MRPSRRLDPPRPVHGFAPRRIVAALWLAAALPACRGDDGPAARAALVVDPGDGRLLTRCVEFPGPATTGVALLERSGLPLAYDASGGLGTLVCSIAGTGCDFPRESCLCRCAGGGDCRYWSYWRLGPDGAWTAAAAGAAAPAVAPGAVEGWRFGDGGDPPGAAGFAAICGAGDG